MVKSLVRLILERRHFWRYATFDEVAQLYASRMLRTAALCLASAFMSIYLYQNGYSVAFIAFFWAAFYGLKMIFALPLALLVGWIGPKHGVLISNILYIPAMVAFALLPEHGTPMLIICVIAQGISAALYSISYSVDFSKVKSETHAGKEIAYMNMAEKITTGLSPLVGGLLAFAFGPQVVIIIAGILFAFAAAPLFRTGEPVKTRRVLTFRGFPWRLMFKHIVAHTAYGFDVFASGTVWSLFVAIYILNIGQSNGVYAATGALLSVVFIVALLASYVYGKLIDKRRGKELMQVGVVVNALTHVLRPFALAPATVVGLNAANEAATTAYTLPYTRAVFDNADLSGARTTYLGMLEIIANFGAGLGAVALGLMAMAFGQDSALHSFFFIAAGVALLVLTARFPLYKK